VTKKTVRRPISQILLCSILCLIPQVAALPYA
jgi:hypothetical protein